MSDFVEWTPKRHGQKPPYWLPDMLTSVDGKNFARQPNWAWIAGSTYYVPHEAVEMPRIEPEPEQTDADRIEALTAENERLRADVVRLRGPVVTYKKGFGPGDGDSFVEEQP